MVKNIIIGLLTLTTVFFIIYAQIQKNFANKQRARAEMTAANAVKTFEEIKKNADVAREAAISAEEIQNQLEACNNGKLNR